MVFKETTIFTRQINKLIDDDEYKTLQEFLLKTPDAGSKIPGSGGIRKLKWALGTHGKRGGFRLIYFLHTSEDVFLMLLAYPKNRQDDLTNEQLNKLKKVVESELGHKK
ncbi:MAG: hypothetical protein GY862_37800 [Gammaproteobacteria bacterium]|nr:hypothetical protein [Gammaproteobacteria bacterium]